MLYVSSNILTIAAGGVIVVLLSAISKDCLLKVERGMNSYDPPDLRQAVYAA